MLVITNEDSAGDRSNPIFPELDEGLSCHHRCVWVVSRIDPMAVWHGEKRKSGLLRQSTNESSGTELHHHGTGSVGSSIFLQEVQTLLPRLQDNISHGSRLFEIPCE
jgi:hypothetical protein